MYNWKRYVAAGIVIGTVYFLPSESFIAFLTGWVILIADHSGCFPGSWTAGIYERQEEQDHGLSKSK